MAELISLIDKHPIGTAVVFFTIIGVILYVFKTRNIKIRGVEITSPNKQNEQLDISRTSEMYIRTLSNVISLSVSHGYDKSIKRQELFDTQMREAKSHFEGIKNRILLNDKIKDKQASIKYIETLLEDAFDTTVYATLRSIFKEDKLSQKDKAKIKEENEARIDSLGDNIIRKLLSYGDVKDENFNIVIKSLEKEKGTIKDMAYASLEKGCDLAVEAEIELQKSEEEFNSKIKQSLLNIYSNEKNLPSNIPDAWDNTMPPNDIIGGE